MLAGFTDRAACSVLSGAARVAPGRKVAVTFDDLPGVSVAGAGTGALRAMTEKLLKDLADNRVPAVEFVNEAGCAAGRSPAPTLRSSFREDPRTAAFVMAQARGERVRRRDRAAFGK